jgi:GT2 family glycosyltransferase
MPEPSDRPWRIRHIDLAEGVPTLEKDPAAAGVLLVFWWGDVPLGQHELPAGRLPLPAGALRAIALDAVTPAVGDRLYEQGFQARLPEYAPRPLPPPGPEALRPPPDPLATAAERVAALEAAAPAATTAVIVCTRERPEDLRICLASFLGLEHGPDEVIVVDNAPKTDATRRVADDAAAAGLAVRYVLEPRPGLSVARNAGLRATASEIVAFTDDDVTVHPKWLLRLRGAFNAPEVMAVTGHMLPAELETEAQQRFQWNHDGGGWGYRALSFDPAFFERTRWRGAPAWNIGAGANMAFRREAFAQVGGFDERLGAGASGCSEDSELWYRLLAAGYTCRYEPSSVVFHTHRRSMDGLGRQLHDYMRGHVTALLTQYEYARHPGDLLRAAYWLPRYYGGWVFRRALGKKGGPSLLGAQVRGFVAGFPHYLRHRNDPAIPTIYETTSAPGPSDAQ